MRLLHHRSPFFDLHKQFIFLSSSSHLFSLKSPPAHSFRFVKAFRPIRHARISVKEARLHNLVPIGAVDGDSSSDGGAGSTVAAAEFEVPGMVDGEVFTSPESEKNFNFTSEERIYKWWESQGYFRPCFERGNEPFVISMPPPNVTGSLHMGHAMFVTLEDIIVRYNRMKGCPTLWLPGTDHAGIATQLVVERMLAAEGIKRSDLSREEFLKRVWEWKEKYGGTITYQMKMLGASCDWTRERFTLDAQLSRKAAS